MKAIKFLFSIVILLITTSVTAQHGINYKAIISDVNGDALANTAVTVHFSIFKNGTVEVYKETHNPTTDINGIIIVNIGEGVPVSGSFHTIDWGANPHFLKTEIDKGDGLTDMGTTEFKTVPYALYAKDSPGATELNDLSDAKTKNGSVYIGRLTGVFDNDSGINKRNIALGYGAGYDNTGAGNIFLGYMAGYHEKGSNKLYINNGRGKPLIHGDFATNVVTINGDLNGSDSGNADMKAYIYGMVTKAGNKISSASSDGFTVSKYGEGIYQILFTGSNKPLGTNSYIVLATAEMMVAGDYNFPATMKITNGFRIFIKKVGEKFHTNSQFSFVVYKK